MDALPSLTSLRISKPLIHSVVLSSSSSFCSHQIRTRRPTSLQLTISCRATRTKGDGDNTNLYKILSVSPKSATMDDIKRTYRSMALRYHPDVCHDPDPSKKEESTRMLVQLNAAYETLSDPMLRQHYDSQFMTMRSTDDDDCNWRRHRWHQQLADLNNRRSSNHHSRSSSWGTRMRAKNIQHFCN